MCPGKFILARLNASLEIGEVISTSALFDLIKSSALLIELNAIKPDLEVGFPKIIFVFGKVTRFNSFQKMIECL